MKEAIGTGATVDAALDAACQAIGLGRDQVEFEILEMPVKKTFGLFGGAPAKVRVFVEDSPSQKALTYLQGLFDAIGIQQPEATVEEGEGCATITLDGEDVGFLIGRRGETLDALQYLAGLVANRGTEQYYRITLNSGNYREKREKTLSSLARRMAISAVRTGRKTSLEPMNPYERRIIHTAVQAVRGATSWSKGEEPNRHVVIGPDKTVKPQANGGRPPRRGGGQRRGGRPSGDRRPAAPAPSPSKEPQKVKPEVPLYGKIDPKNYSGSDDQ